MVNDKLLEDAKKGYDDLMDYLKSLSNDAIFWLLLCVNAELHRRQETHEGCYVETREGFPQ